MSNPKIYYDNVLVRAENGAGDGTIYGQGTGIGNDIDDATENFRFVLTSIALITELGADADDKFLGYTIYFPASGNRYHVTDWTASTNTAVVAEIPNEVDIGATVAYEMRRTVYALGQTGGEIAARLSDRLRSPALTCRDNATSFDIREIALPNLIDHGGAEDLTTFPDGGWTMGSPGTISLLTSGAILGSKSFRWNADGNTTMYHRLNAPVRTDKRYRICMKTRANGGSTSSGAVAINILRSIGGGFVIPTQTLGVLTTTPTWYVSPQITPTEDSDFAGLSVAFTDSLQGAATSVDVDEIYLWEEVVVSALVILSHTFDGGGMTNLVYGYYAPPGRTGESSDEYDTLYAGTPTSFAGNRDTVQALTGTPTLAGAPTGVYPVYRVLVNFNSLFAFSCGELLLGSSRTLDHAPLYPFDPLGYKMKEVRNEALSGAEYRTLFSVRRGIMIDLEALSDADAAILKGRFYETVIRDGQWCAIAWADAGIDLLPLLYDSDSFGMPFQEVFYQNVNLPFKEFVA